MPRGLPTSTRFTHHQVSRNDESNWEHARIRNHIKTIAKFVLVCIPCIVLVVTSISQSSTAQTQGNRIVNSRLDASNSSRRHFPVERVAFQESIPDESSDAPKLNADGVSFGNGQQSSAFDRFRQRGRPAYDDRRQPSSVSPVPPPQGFTNVYRNPAVAPRQPIPVSPPQLPSQDPGQFYEVAPINGAPSDIQINESNGLINIVARDAFLRDVLALLAKQYNLNFVHGEIDDRISISLRQVTLQVALTSLLSVAGCTWSNNQGIIHISSLSPTTRANLSPALAGLQVRVFPLDFGSAVDINQVVIGMLSPAGISYVLVTDPKDNRKTTDAIVVEDTPASLIRIEQYIRQIDVPPRQVLIEAKVLEVRLRDNEKHGVNFEHIASISGKQIKLGSLGMDPSGSGTLFAEIDMPDLQGFIDALQTTVDTTTLASPRIMALNGQEARLQVGQQLGFRVVTTTQTSTLEDVRFLDVGIVLAITPRIARDGRILLHVKPEVSSGQINPDTGLPEEETSEVETNVMLAHGKGMIIGGLIQERDSDTASQAPRIGNIPVVGSLFRRQESQKQRTEVIFVLMPRIVESAGDQSTYPMDTFALDQRDQLDAIRSQNHILGPDLRNYRRPFEHSAAEAERERVYSLHNQLTPHNAYDDGYMFEAADRHPRGCRCQRCKFARSENRYRSRPVSSAYSYPGHQQFINPEYQGSHNPIFVGQKQSNPPIADRKRRSTQNPRLTAQRERTSSVHTIRTRGSRTPKLPYPIEPANNGPREKVRVSSLPQKTVPSYRFGDTNR